MNESVSEALREVFSADNSDRSSELSLQRYKCVCAYDGTDFSGWQSQITSDSVQDFIERRLGIIFKRQVRIHGSGRTDAGVHADGQVFHFDVKWGHSEEALLAAMRSSHNEAIRFLSLSKVSDKFHARYGVWGKRYVYDIFIGRALPRDTRYCWSLDKGAPDIKAMQSAASVLLGVHDFTAFSANRGPNVKDNPVKELRRLDISKRGRWIRVTTEGSGYLYKMVRILVGSLVSVGLGALTRDDIERALQSGKRSNLFAAAPAKGLTLAKVFYAPRGSKKSPTQTKTR